MPPQGFGQLKLAEQRAKIEEDRGVEQRLRLRNANPGAELLLPFVQGQAPLRVAGHDVAFAQREPAAIEILVDVESEGQKTLAQAVDRSSVITGEDNAIILIGHKRLLITAFRTKGQPAPFDTVEVVIFKIKLQDPPGQRIVKRRNELGQLLGTNALGQHVEGQLADVGVGLLQRFNILGRVDGLAYLAQAHTLQGKEIAFGNHTGQLTFSVGDQNVTDAV